MAGKNNFAELKKYATKVYKFQQGTSIRALDPSTPRQQTHGASINAIQMSAEEFNEIKGGICAALAANWLKEKLTSPDDLVFSGPSTGSGVHTGQNLATVLDNAPLYRQYAKSPSASAALALHGLKPSSSLARLDPTVQQQSIRINTYSPGTDKEYKQRVVVSEPLVGASLTKACSEEYLKQGRGVYISFSVLSRNPAKQGGGHATAAYRSRGNSLYFFDPNCGVYKIQDVAGFFGAYVGCYAALGYDLDLQPHRKDGFYYLKR